MAREGVRDYEILAGSGSGSRLKQLKQERVSARPLGPRTQKLRAILLNDQHRGVRISFSLPYPLCLHSPCRAQLKRPSKTLWMLALAGCGGEGGAGLMPASEKAREVERVRSYVPPKRRLRR